MDIFTILPAKLKIRKFPSCFPGFFISPEWHLCIISVKGVTKRLKINKNLYKNG